MDGERESERQINRQTNRQTDRDSKTDKQRGDENCFGDVLGVNMKGDVESRTRYSGVPLNGCIESAEESQ